MVDKVCPVVWLQVFVRGAVGNKVGNDDGGVSETACVMEFLQKLQGFLLCCVVWHDEINCPAKSLPNNTAFAERKRKLFEVLATSCLPGVSLNGKLRSSA